MARCCKGQPAARCSRPACLPTLLHLLLPPLLPVLPQEPASGGKSARVGSGGKKAAPPAETADKKKAPAAAAPTAVAAKKKALQPGSSAAEGAVKREKKVFDMPGQTRETPAEVRADGAGGSAAARVGQQSRAGRRQPPLH